MSAKREKTQEFLAFLDSLLVLDHVDSSRYLFAAGFAGRMKSSLVTRAKKPDEFCIVSLTVKTSKQV